MPEDTGEGYHCSARPVFFVADWSPSSLMGLFDDELFAADEGVPFGSFSDRDSLIGAPPC